MIPTRSHFRIVLRWVLYSCLGFAVVYGILILHVLTQFAGTAVTGADCALVFGAAAHSKDSAGPGITRRVTAAADLFKKGRVERIIFTGGRGSDFQETEAGVMRRTAMLQGVPPEHILLEENSTSTWENLAFTRPLTEDCSSVIGISDRYHLARIRLLARQQGWENFTTYPAAPPPGRWFEVRSVLREALAMGYYLLASLWK